MYLSPYAYNTETVFARDNCDCLEGSGFLLITA